MRPISNVVDATNLALLELGHPLHGFDLDKLAGHRIVVRRAREGEPMTTLDGKAVTGPSSNRAFVFQRDSLFPWRTVRDNVMYGLDLQGKLGAPRHGGLVYYLWSLTWGLGWVPALVTVTRPAVWWRSRASAP